jgi:hypothetical protein
VTLTRVEEYMERFADQLQLRSRSDESDEPKDHSN